MENTGVILNILKNLKSNEDIVRYCGTSSTVRRICKEYSKSLYGKTYNEIIYSVAIEHTFPTLHHVVSLDQLYKYYNSYPMIWKLLNYGKNIGEIPMCRTLDEPYEYMDDDLNVIDPYDPKNIKYIGPFHRAILEGHKKLTFLFYRGIEKIPTNIFMLEEDEVITPYHFIQMGDIENLTDLINRQSKNFIHDKYNRKTWEEYIQDPYWINKKMLSIEDEIELSDNTSTCDGYSATGFARTKKAMLFEKYFKLDHPAVEIDFDT